MKQHAIFQEVQTSSIQSSTFDMSHDVKTSFNMGELIPVLNQEVYPGDTWKCSSENMLRFQPLLGPIMHKVHVKMEYFFVPNRILWTQWKNFITGKTTPDHPFFTGLSEINKGSLGDYMGLPIDGLDDTQNLNALPVKAYQQIWNDWYRAQHIQEERGIPLNSGENTLMGDLAKGEPYKRGWRMDYFTAGLPFAQEGDAVKLPLTNTGTVPVVLDLNDGLPQPQLIKRANGDPQDQQSLRSSAVLGTFVAGNGTQAYLDPNGTLKVDLEAEAVEITTLRNALIVQEFLETKARSGSRYVESLRAFFKVKSSDARLQRAEYIGGHTQNMAISEVLATAETTNTPIAAAGIVTPVGQMSGHGISVGSTSTLSYTAEEHGFIMAIASVVPMTAYQQGIHKQWQRFDQFDYAWPQFSHIGEQEVLNKELYAGVANPDISNGTFAYMPRYGELKFINSKVSGDLRDNLDFWHLGRKFSNLPTLSEEFIECDPDRRIFAVIDEEVDSIIAHFYMNITANRRFPKHAVPHV